MVNGVAYNDVHVNSRMPDAASGPLVVTFIGVGYVNVGYADGPPQRVTTGAPVVLKP